MILLSAGLFRFINHLSNPPAQMCPCTTIPHMRQVAGAAYAPCPGALPQYIARRKPMKKSDFIAAVAKEAGITRVEADKVVNAALSIISHTLKSGEKVTLTGFGTFEVRERAARAGMNIRTKEKIRIPASN